MPHNLVCWYTELCGQMFRLNSCCPSSLGVLFGGEVLGGQGLAFHALPLRCRVQARAALVLELVLGSATQPTRFSVRELRQPEYAGHATRAPVAAALGLLAG